MDLAEKNEDSIGRPDCCGCPEFQRVDLHSTEKPGSECNCENDKTEADKACVGHAQFGDGREVIKEGSTFAFF